MISFIENKNIDKSKWDRCVDPSFNKSFFSFSYVLDIISPNWNALVLNDYEAVFPLTGRKKYRINYLFQPFFANYFDVYTEIESKYNTVSGEFLKAIPAQYRYIDICLAPAFKKNLPDIKFTERKLQLLDISVPLDQLRKKYSDNLKRNIKKAIKEDIKLEFDFSIETHVNDFRKENSKKIKEFKTVDYNTMKLLLTELKKREKAFVVLAKTKDGKVCGSASFITCGKRLVYFKSSSNDYGKKTGAIHFLMDAIIEKYKDKYDVLDFYGSNVSSVARFNEGFNTIDYIYYRIKRNKLPPLLKLIKK